MIRCVPLPVVTLARGLAIRWAANGQRRLALRPPTQNATSLMNRLEVGDAPCVTKYNLRSTIQIGSVSWMAGHGNVAFCLDFSLFVRQLSRYHDLISLSQAGYPYFRQEAPLKKCHPARYSRKRVAVAGGQVRWSNWRHNGIFHKKQWE